MAIRTLVDLLRTRAENTDEGSFYIYLKDGVDESASLSFQELDLRARSIASKLQLLDAFGERAILLCPQGLDFLCGFFGCLYAGVVVVPAYVPRAGQSIGLLEAMVVSSEAKYLLTTDELSGFLRERISAGSSLAGVKSISINSILNDTASDWNVPSINSNSLAFLQYTSGSTGIPKGVMITHANVLHNLSMLSKACKTKKESRSVSWAPLVHNTGLVAGVLLPLFDGFQSVIMSPLDFLQNPSSWLSAISRYRATFSFGPNFGYQLALQNISVTEMETFDLSSWEIAGCGSETIYAETLEAFYKTFSKCGFRWQSLKPGYGLADSVVFVSSGAPSKVPTVIQVNKEALEENRIEIVGSGSAGNRIVGCGQAWLDEKIVIVNPTTLTLCAGDRVGEIWISSSSVAKGYWGQPDLTNEIFNADLAQTGEGPFLRTGDCGFLHDGELFVTGRLKELIIIRGRNYYPHDIEKTVVKSHPALQPGGCAAFSVDINREEQLVVTQEVKPSFVEGLDVDLVVKGIRLAISRDHGLQLLAIQLLKPRSSPRTLSGKIKRYACRRGYINDEFDIVAQWSRTGEDRGHDEGNSSLVKLSCSIDTVENWLIDTISKLSGEGPNIITRDSLLSNYALDSVQAVAISAELGDLLNRRLSPSLIWDFPSIKDITEHVVNEASSPSLEVNIDWSKEIDLDPQVTAKSRKVDNITIPRNILLTGSTGFLGAFLLKDLIEESSATIYCLVRALDDQSAAQRIKERLESYEIWEEHFESRIVAIAGNVSIPRFGLSKDRYSDLANDVDVVYHGAALLNYVFPYERFKQVNVFGTEEVLRFACCRKVKPLNHISSIAVFESSAYNQIAVYESDLLKHSEGMYLGYSQSKWVAEKLVMAARERGLPVLIYRPSFIAGHSETGVCNTNDIICRVVKGCVLMKSMADLDFSLDISPVDYVSKAIVYLSKQKESIGKAFHLNNSNPINWKDLCELLRLIGYSIREIPFVKWQSELESKALTVDNPLYPLLPFFVKKWSNEQLTISELYQQERRAVVNCDTTERALVDSGLTCPPVNIDLLSKYFSYFKRSGFL